LQRHVLAFGRFCVAKCFAKWPRVLPRVPQGLVSRDEAVQMVEPRHLDQLLHPQFEDPEGYAKSVLGRGLAASPGAAVGRVVFSAEDAEQWRERGERVSEASRRLITGRVDPILQPYIGPLFQ
jgi:phosphoenolpyruvate synthase/pyruvate phosphate dikinase